MLIAEWPLWSFGWPLDVEGGELAMSVGKSDGDMRERMMWRDVLPSRARP